MWTYLTLLFSFVLIVVIFVRKVQANKARVTEAAAPKPELIEEDEEKAKIRLSKEEKESVESLYKRGESFLNTGKDDEGIKCFVQVLSLNPDHLETQQKLALLYLQKQMYGAAAALFERLSVLTEDAVHYSHLGLALYQQSAFEKAKLAYQKAVSLDPSRPQRFVSLAQVYRSLGQGNNAAMALNKAIELDAQNVEFLYLLADLQVELKSLELAREILGKIFLIDEENKEAKALLKQIRAVESEGR